MPYAPSPSVDELAEVTIRRERLAGRINAINPTAPVEWLGRFDDDSLSDYLDRLERLSGRRGPTTRWERRPSRPAAEGRIPEEN